MSGFGFDTFQVTDQNRSAFAACRDIASGESTGGALVVLLGPEQSGKSHLLWSIAKQVRGSTARMGLALIMAREFPQKVRDLVRDAAPISGGRRAVLLVDQLDQFRENIADLEAVVRLFLDHGQNVVAATRIHPGRLSRFSEDFRRLLTACTVLELEAPSRTEEAHPTGPTGAAAALEAELGTLREARGQLEDRLRLEANARSIANESVADLEAEVTLLRGARAELEKKLAEAVGLASEVATLNGRISAAEAESLSLRHRLKQSEAEAASAFAEQARLQGQLSARLRAEEDLAEELQARTEAEAALTTLRKAVAGLLAWTDVEAAGEDPVAALPALLGELEARRLLLVHHTVLEEQARQRDDALKALAELEHQSEEVAHAHTARLAELEETVARHEATVRVAVETREDLERTVREREALLSTAETELEKAHKQISLTTAEMEALRHEAAAQVASANIQTGELQHRLSTLQAALALHHGTGREVANGLRREAAGFSQTAELLAAMASCLDHLPDVPEMPPETDLSALEQPTLFGDEAFVWRPPAPPPTDLAQIADDMTAMEPTADTGEGDAEPHA